MNFSTWKHPIKNKVFLVKKANIVLSDLSCETILTHSLNLIYCMFLILNKIFHVGKNILTRDVDSIRN